MRILALETSVRPGSLALYEEGQLLAEASLPAKQKTTSALTPSIQKLLAEQQWQPTDIQLVATTVGPGSFTGLRVAVTTAKTLAYAVGAKTLGLNTLEVIAFQAAEKQAAAQEGEATQDGPPVIDAVMDAGRGDLFAARYRITSPDSIEAIVDPHLTPASSWSDSLSADSIISGPAFEKEGLINSLPPHLSITDKTYWNPAASMVGRLAGYAHQAGRRDDLWQLIPHYFRKSAAEEKWEQREKQ